MEIILLSILKWGILVFCLVHILIPDAAGIVQIEQRRAQDTLHSAFDWSNLSSWEMVHSTQVGVRRY